MRRHYFEILKVPNSRLKWVFALEWVYQTVYLGFDFPVAVAHAHLPAEHRAYLVGGFAREGRLSRNQNG